MGQECPLRAKQTQLNASLPIVLLLSLNLKVPPLGYAGGEHVLSLGVGAECYYVDLLDDAWVLSCRTGNFSLRWTAPLCNPGCFVLF